MRTKTYIYSIFSVFFALVTFISCSKGEDKINSNKVDITININYKENINYSDFKVKITDIRTNSTIEKALSNGSLKISLNKDTYTFVIEGKDKDKLYYGKKESYPIKNAEILQIDVKVLNMNKSDLIFKEIFFNGQTYNGRMQHPDQYLTIFNNGDEVLYVDGVVIAETQQENWHVGDMFSRYLPDNIIVQTMYQIPGDGNDYILEPGKQIVIAATAIDHGVVLPGATDLSGADFEIYDYDLPHLKDIDIPNVPNLIRHHASEWGFMPHPKGVTSLFIFDPKEPMEEFMKKNKIEFSDHEIKSIFLYKVPTNLVLDGIESGITDDVKTKGLPAAVDKGYITVPSCHRGLLVKRKSIIKNGREYLIDTNDSSNDCLVVNRTTNYPKK